MDELSIILADKTSKKTNDELIDALEAEIITNHPPVYCEIKNYFTKGLYIREMTAPAGALITSKIHKTQHPFTISKGVIQVRDENGNWTTLSAPFTGITKPGTRRVAIVLEECVWTTYHACKFITGQENDLSEQEQTVITDRIERLIIKKRVNKILASKKEQICLT